MSIRFPRTVTALSAIGIAAVLFVGCSSGGQPNSTTTGGAATPTSNASGGQPTPSATTTAAAAPTCDSLIVSDVHEQLTAQGWTFRETPLAAGGVTLDTGLECTWADFAVPSGNLMLFGWGSLTDNQAATMQQGLVTEGWLREESGGHVFITEDPMQAPTVDDNGYGMTYEFGEGRVMVADTKQNLLLIQRPQS